MDLLSADIDEFFKEIERENPGPTVSSGHQDQGNYQEPWSAATTYQDPVYNQVSYVEEVQEDGTTMGQQFLNDIIGDEPWDSTPHMAPESAQHYQQPPHR